MRGVAVNPNIIRTVIERNWVRVVGHRDVPGHPELLGTTREFLDYFGLKYLDDLPPLAELQAMPEVHLQLDLPAEEAAAEALEVLPDSSVSADGGDAEEGTEDEGYSAEAGASRELVAGPADLDS